MYYLADRPLTFFVNGKKIDLEPIGQDVFDTRWAAWLNRYPFREIDYEWYCYTVVVSKAISRFFGSKVFAIHQNGNIAFEGWDNGKLVGNFVVYSDYITINSIDASNYRDVKKAAA